MKKIVFALTTLLTIVACTNSKPTTDEDGSVVVRETRIFSILGKDTLKLDVYINPQAKVKPDGRPVMLYIHGGGFTAGSRINAAQEVFLRYMAERGWLALSVDYRLAGVSMGENGTLKNPYNVDGTLSAVRMACSDVVDATIFVLKQTDWKADPAKFCLGGGSAGAITALQTMYDVCNEETYAQKLPEGFAYAGVISQAGCIGVDMSQTALTWKKKPCPIMFFHGTEDNEVPLETSQLDCRLFGTLAIVRQMQEMEVPYWKWIEQGADHVMAMKPLTTYLEEQYRFLNDFVINGLQSTVSTEVTDKEPANMASPEAMVKYVPLYILGYGKYLDEMDWSNMQKPTGIVY